MLSNCDAALTTSPASACIVHKNCQRMHVSSSGRRRASCMPSMSDKSLVMDTHLLRTVKASSARPTAMWEIAVFRVTLHAASQMYRASSKSLAAAMAESSEIASSRAAEEVFATSEPEVGVAASIAAAAASSSATSRRWRRSAACDTASRRGSSAASGRPASNQHRPVSSASLCRRPRPLPAPVLSASSEVCKRSKASAAPMKSRFCRSCRASNSAAAVDTPGGMVGDRIGLRMESGRSEESMLRHAFGISTHCPSAPTKHRSRCAATRKSRASNTSGFSSPERMADRRSKIPLLAHVGKLLGSGFDK
mmetsp:Transcript_45777/g.82883  ORF Transcript_45777/g.82883 Transcript_45777/m.82883 type:complete len:308 (+) Transcript_45777:244-1167(+)